MTTPRPSNVAARYRTARQTFDPAWYGLDGFVAGKPTTLYHGTTASFRRFDPGKSRTELVGRFYGSGIFLTPDKRVAWDYADANRNIGFPPSLVDDLKKANPNAGWFLEQLVKHGYSKAYDDLLADPPFPAGDGLYTALDRWLKGADPNTLGDISEYVLGSKSQGGPPSEIGSGLDDDVGGLLDMLGGGGSTGAPDYIYDALDEVGLDSTKYRPKVYTVRATAKNPLVTDSQAEARKAKARGHDAVIYHGPQTVRDIPEVALFDPRNAKITKVEVQS